MERRVQVQVASLEVEWKSRKSGSDVGSRGGRYLRVSKKIRELGGWLCNRLFRFIDTAVQLQEISVTHYTRVLYMLVLLFLPAPFEPLDFCFFRVERPVFFKSRLLKHLSPSKKQLTRSIGIVSLNVLARYKSTITPFSSIKNSLGNIVTDWSPCTTAVLIMGTTCLNGRASFMHPNRFRRPTRNSDDTIPSGSARA